MTFENMKHNIPKWEAVMHNAMNQIKDDKLPNKAYRMIYMFYLMNPNNEPISILKIRQKVTGDKKIVYGKQKLFFALLSKIISKMKNKGILIQMNNIEAGYPEVDKRIKYIQLTKKGLKLTQELEKNMKKEWGKYE